MTSPFRRAFVVGLVVGLVALLAAPHARAEGPEAGLARAEEHLKNERSAEAIAELEALADMGHVDAAIAFDRGLAYARRIQQGHEVEGDLGRAVLGFEEARALTTSPEVRAACDAALTQLRSEAAKRRSRGGEPEDVEEGLSLGRSVVHLLPEAAWFWLSVALSLTFTAGLFVRRRANARGEASQLGLVLGLASLPLCLATTTSALSARAERRELREGIVVRPGVRPAGPDHIVTSGADTLPEGAKVRILGEDGDAYLFRRGPVAGTLPKDAVGEIVRRR